MTIRNLRAYDPTFESNSILMRRRLRWIGLTNLAVDVLIFEILFEFGVPFLTALTTSFVAASIFDYIVCSQRVFGDDRRIADDTVWEEGMRFFSVCLLGFGLRGGIIADAMQFLHLAPFASVVLGSVAAAVIGYLGNLFFVFRASGHVVSASARWRMAAIGIFLYMLALRLVFLGRVKLVPEEAYYWNFSQHLDIGYLDHPPMSAWLIWLGTAIFSKTEFGVRIGACIAWIAVSFFVYRFTANLFDRSTAAVGLVLTAVLPVFFYTGFIMTPDVPLTVAWAGAIYFLERALVSGKRRAWWGVGICAGLGMVSKYTLPF